MIAFSIILKKTCLSSDSSPITKIPLRGIKNLHFSFLNNFNGSQIFFYKTPMSKFDELFIKINPKFYVKHGLFKKTTT